MCSKKQTDLPLALLLPAGAQLVMAVRLVGCLMKAMCLCLSQYSTQLSGCVYTPCVSVFGARCTLLHAVVSRGLLTVGVVAFLTFFCSSGRPPLDRTLDIYWQTELNWRCRLDWMFLRPLVRTREDGKHMAAETMKDCCCCCRRRGRSFCCGLSGEDAQQSLSRRSLVRSGDSNDQKLYGGGNDERTHDHLTSFDFSNPNTHATNTSPPQRNEKKRN